MDSSALESSGKRRNHPPAGRFRILAIKSLDIKSYAT
jgi:hypothetical protein